MEEQPVKHLTPEAAALAFAAESAQINPMTVRTDLPVQVFEIAGQGAEPIYVAAVPVLERFDGVPDPVPASLVLAIGKVQDDEGDGAEHFEVFGMMQPAYDTEEEGGE